MAEQTTYNQKIQDLIELIANSPRYVIEPGDVLVITVKQPLSRRIIDNVRKAFEPIRSAVGVDQLVIMDNGSDLSKMSKDDIKLILEQLR